MSDAVGQAKQYTTTTRDRLLKTLSFVPDEKLNWSPSPSAKTLLQIAAHAGVSNHGLAAIVRGDPLGASSPQEMEAKQAKVEAAITTRARAIEVLNESTNAVLSALDGLTADRIASEVKTPFFTAPMAFWMNLPGRHMDNHAAQIDYLQTCWNDQDWHM